MSRASYISVLVATSVVLAVAAPAQVSMVSGSVSDTLTGPFVSGTVYWVVGAATVPGGQTLTVQAGPS